MNNIKYVGMDVHKSITVIVVLNAAGQIESRTPVKTKVENMCDFFHGLSGIVEGVLPVNRLVSERAAGSCRSRWMGTGAPKAHKLSIRSNGSNRIETALCALRSAAFV